MDDVLGLLERFRDYPILHVIDLDAAMRKGSNSRWIKTLCKKGKMKGRVGGGIRTAARAEKNPVLGRGKGHRRQRRFRRRKNRERSFSQSLPRASARRTSSSLSIPNAAASSFAAGKKTQAAPRRSDPGTRTLLLRISLHLCRQRRHHEGHRPEMVSASCAALRSFRSPLPAAFAA